LGGENLKAENNVAMLNPLSNELDVMRQSLIFSSLEVVSHNQNRQNPDLKLFEFGKRITSEEWTYKVVENGVES
jgi:phenylalanyl-tRNA synthetase beta chain